MIDIMFFTFCTSQATYLYFLLEDIYEETDDPLPASPGPVSMRLASSSTSIPETNGNNGKITNPDKTKPPGQCSVHNF